MRAAIRDDNPVLFLEHMALYHAGNAEVGDGAPVALGKAKVTHKGTDLSIYASVLMTKRALAAAKVLADSGISAEVVDLRTISPLDEDTILMSARKTGRALVLSEAIGRGSSSNDVAALLAEYAFDDLKAPVTRLAPPNIPTPFARELEREYLPSEDRIVEATKAQMCLESSL